MSHPKHTIALTGATGFVGRHVLDALGERGHAVRALVRDPAKVTHKPSGLSTIEGDLFSPTTLEELCRGCDTVIHLVGIIMENSGKGQTFEHVHVDATRNLLAAAKKQGIKRWIHMSALGSRPDAQANYHQSKWKAEQLVRESGLDYTIFRPSIIHGHDGEFMEMVKSFWCDPMPPFVPYFGTKLPLGDIPAIFKQLIWPFKPVGMVDDPTALAHAKAGNLQPVWVEDVAACFADAVTHDKCIDETYPMGGPEEYTWPKLYATAGKYLPRARGKYIIPMPVWKAKILARLPFTPFNMDQVIMSQEESTCNIEKVEQHFGRKMAKFEDKVAEYAARIGE